MSQDLQNSKIILTFFFFVLFIPSNIFGLEECPKNNLKARLDYDSGVFWSGRGKYQKAYDLLSNALKICPDYSDAITKKKEVEIILEEQKQAEKIERERKLKAQLEAQREAEERRRYQEHLRSEREKAFKEAKEREKKEQEAAPRCTQGRMWEFVVNNAYRTADEYAMNRNRNSIFFNFSTEKINHKFVRQDDGIFKGKYLLLITNRHGNKTSFAALLPLFDVNQSSEGLDDEGTLWEVVSATLNGIPY